MPASRFTHSGPWNLQLITVLTASLAPLTIIPDGAVVAGSAYFFRFRVIRFSGRLSLEFFGYVLVPA